MNVSPPSSARPSSGIGWRTEIALRRKTDVSVRGLAYAGRMHPARPPLIDIAVAGAFVVLVVAEAVLSPMVRSPLLHLTVAGVAMAGLAWRRALPIPVAVLIMASNLLLNPDGQFSTLLSMVLVAYTNGAENKPPWHYLGLAVIVIPFITALSLEDLEPSDLAAALVFLVGPWAIGTAVRQRALLTEQAEERARRVEQEREREVAAAAAQERTRIARELHDIVSHSISVIAIQTQAVRRRLAADQVREAEDLAAVETTAREALAEMRRLFGVLRSDDEAASLDPQPGLHELDRLTDQVRASGLDVRVTVGGTAYPLPPGMDLAAYRIVQEGLTNALRHSGARRATVLLRYADSCLEIAVEDDGRGLDPAAPAAGGHGLLGLRERVALYDGTLEVRAGADRGTRLVASLPMTTASTGLPPAMRAR